MTTRSGRAPRIALLVVLGLASAFGVWVSHKAGRDALGTAGGILVGVVAALMLGAVLYVLGVVMLAPSRVKSGRSQMRRRREW